MATAPDRSPARMFMFPAPAPPATGTQLPRVWAQAPYVNTGLTTVEIGAVAGCGMLSDGVVVAFHRAGATMDWSDPTKNLPITWTDPIVLLSKSGEVLSSFGGDHGFVIPHGVFVDHEDCIWVTDCGLHQVFKFDRKGTLLMTLGTEGGPDPDRRAQKDSDNSDPYKFNKPADVSVNPSDGTIFVADGYGNSRVVAFNPEGVFRRMFGGVFGTGPKQINCAHNCAYAEGKLVVCDRNNSRFHIYDAESTEHLETWEHGATMTPEEERTFASNPGHYTGYTWAVRWDPVTRLLYSLEGSECVIRSLHEGGRVLGKWDVNPGHDLLVDTRDGVTTVHIGEMQAMQGKVPCFCGCEPFSTNL